MPHEQRCDGCGVESKGVAQAALCPCCVAALKKSAADPPDFSGVTETTFTLGERLVPDDLARDRKGAPLSAVVPLFRSERYAQKTIRSLVKYLPHGSEIICVDDGSPDRSGEIAVKELAGFERGLVVRLDRNTGYAHAVNAGARHASGRYILMWNADCFARAGFAGPMIEILDRFEDVAIVGNRHFRPDGTVDSEGSEWGWDTGTYRHVGRKLADPHPDRVMSETLTPRRLDRDAVTFACCLIRGSVWRELGGIDERYRIGYWEDVDFCLRAREAGWRVAWTPDSEIVHVGNHTQSSDHAWRDRNRALFHKRWAETGIVDKHARARGLAPHQDKNGRGRVVVCMIACSEAEFIGAALESVYPLADKIVVVEGGTRYAVEAGLCDAHGRSTDETFSEIVEARSRLRDAEKVKVVGSLFRPWADKREMRNACLEHVRPGDWMILLDADEVFTEAGLWRLSALMHRDVDIIRPAFRLFWNDMHTLGTGRWHDFRQVKVVRWREGWSYDRDHNMPTDRSGKRIVDLPGVKVLDPAEPLYHHYSWAGRTGEKLAAKCRYYVAQNKGEGKGGFPADYMERVFIPWRSDPVRIEKAFGTHPYGGGGTQPFTGDHPEPVRRRMAVTE